MKKIISVVLCLLSIATLFIIPVSANNHTDTNFSFNLPATYKYIVNLNGRIKQDATGSYILSDSTNVSEGALFSIHGYNSQYPSSASQVTNCTKNTSARIWPGQARRIRQYVYEWGYTYAFIGGSAITNAGVGHELTGVWSPDSVGSYPYCN